MKKYAALAVVAGLALSSTAMAQFTTTATGPIASTGPAGDAGNGIIANTYTGASTLFGTLGFSGDLTEVLTGTFASEARWRIRNLANGGVADFQPSTIGNFDGTINIARNVNVLAWANTNDSVTFEAFESFNDGAGPDAVWSNVDFTFRGEVACTDLGVLNGAALDINTFGSNFDTELALYSSAGALLGSNDDTGGLQSQILAAGLGDDLYYVVVGGFNSGFGNGFAFPGGAAGDYLLNINGEQLAAGSLASGSFGVYCFTVPTPGAAALLGLGGLAACRRRRA